MTNNRKPDVAGLVSGLLATGGAAIWLLHDQHVVSGEDTGLWVALLLVLSGILGLAASGRG